MIRVFDNLDRFSEEQYQRLYEQLPPSRKEKAAVRDGNNRKVAISEYFLLNELLNLTDNVDFSYNENGKPLLSGYNFSISHCDDVICIAIGETQIGVDIEKIRKYNENFAKFILNDEELAFIEKQPNKDELITKFWTQKDATIKCLGLALNTPLKNVINGEQFDYKLDKYKDYYLCQCTLKNKM